MKISRLLPTVMLLLAGCADIGDRQGYPSLARRPIESPKAENSVSAPEVAPAVADNSPLTAQLEDLAKRATKGTAAFDAYSSDAARFVAAASDAASGSESWVIAHQAVSRLESARNDCVSALASLDVLYADRMKAIAEGTTSGGIEQIDAVRVPLLAVVDRQNDQLDRLRGRLR